MTPGQLREAKELALQEQENAKAESERKRKAEAENALKSSALNISKKPWSYCIIFSYAIFTTIVVFQTYF